MAEVIELRAFRAQAVGEPRQTTPAIAFDVAVLPFAVWRMGIALWISLCMAPLGVLVEIIDTEPAERTPREPRDGDKITSHPTERSRLANGL